MNVGRIIAIRLAAAGPLLAAVIAFSLAAAAGSGDWVRRDHSAVRLVAGESEANGRLAGVEFELAEGWKTYWRMPGESGVPAEFDWSGSLNVADVEVEWPAPHRMVDAAGEGVGYDGHVVFPLHVRLDDPEKPARLDLKLFYAVCKDICIPASADLSLDLAPGPADGAGSGLIARFQALVPAEDRQGKGLIGARPVTVEGKPYLAVTVAPDLAAGDVDIFVEGIDDAYFRKPKEAVKTAGGVEFRLPVDGIKEPEKLTGRKVRITWVAGDRSLFRELEVE
jgi:DsbC/DsbD-like thiol-disulfide interchange protein